MPLPMLNFCGKMRSKSFGMCFSEEKYAFGYDSKVPELWPEIVPQIVIEYFGTKRGVHSLGYVVR